MPSTQRSIKFSEFPLINYLFLSFYTDLGWTVTDLVRNKGSKAAAILREKADQLEEALNETKSKYTVEMMPD